MKRLLTTLLVLSTAIVAFSQTLLSPGDLAIIAVNSDGSKSFAVLFFRDVEAGTEIHFTDNAWRNEEQSFRETEGILTLTTSQLITAGTVLSCPSKDGGNGFVESGSFNPSGSGDNIIVYQGTSDDPFFIYGVGWARGASVWEYSNVSSSYRSDVPMGLSFDDGTLVSLGTGDDYIFSGGQVIGWSGTRGSLFALLSDASNYSRSNSSEFSWTEGNFTIESQIIADTGGSFNWSDVFWTNGVPSRFSEVIIYGTVFIDYPVVVHSLSIQDGASIEILPGGSLTVVGDMENLSGSDGLIIRADETGSGALYSTTYGVDGRVEVFLTPNQWHFISSPVTSSQTIEELFGTIGDHLQGVYEFDESTNQWITLNPKSRFPSPDSLNSGYNIKYKDNGKTLSFAGILNNFRNRKFYSISRGAGGGWNLLGNPFPAPMSWMQSMTSDNLEHETVYITTGGSGGDTQWDTFNGTSGVGVPSNEVGNIAVGQGFWVRSGEGGGELGMNSYCTTLEASAFKALGSSGGSPFGPHFRGDDRLGVLGGNMVLRLELCDEEGQKDQVAICFNNEAEEGFDSMDSEKLGWNPNDERRETNNALAISVPVEQKNCVIASYPDCGVIPIEIYSNNRTTLSLSLQQNAASSIFLEDRHLGIIHDFSKHPVYEFYSEGGLSLGRFFLRTYFGVVDDMVSGEEEVRNGEGIETQIEYYAVDGRRINNIENYTGIYIKRCIIDGLVRVEKLFK